MADLKKHIAVLLFGIFIFPLAFQPLHVLMHHTQVAHDCHSCCETKLDKKESVKLAIIETASAEEEACAICDYHFPLNIIAKNVICHNIKVVVECKLFRLNKQLPFLQVISVKSPRGPPALL